jgi:hypothetical protein
MTPKNAHSILYIYIKKALQTLCLQGLLLKISIDSLNIQKKNYLTPNYLPASFNFIKK